VIDDLLAIDVDTPGGARIRGRRVGAENLQVAAGVPVANREQWIENTPGMGVNEIVAVRPAVYPWVRSTSRNAVANSLTGDIGTLRW
jgi:hypothetical protein